MHSPTVPPENSALNPTESLQVQNRVIAVWALAEGTLGGILHGLHIPVTGLVVGSISVCCLALLARLNHRPGNLMKATVLVLLIKAMLSPHTPPAAYFAVFSQGLAAELFFASPAHFKVKSYFFGILTQLQSAIQHLIVVTVVFGMGLWQAFDKYLDQVMQKLGIEGESYALYLAVIYVALHAVMGIFIGWVAGNLPDWLPKRPTPALPETTNAVDLNLKPKPHGFKLKPGLWLIWLLLLLVFLQSYFGLGPQILPQTKVVQILVRSALIATAWYFLISPLLLKMVHQWLQRKKGPLQNELEAILNLLPETKAILSHCWKQTTALAGLKRLKAFVKLAGRQLFTLPA
jgi:hypothetical protein